jgi:hypothetical protein
LSPGRQERSPRFVGIHLAGNGGGIALKSCEAFRAPSENFSRANQLNRQDLVITLAARDRPR